MNPRKTPVTIALIAANVLAFVFEVSRVGADLLAGGGTLQALVNAGALVPVLVRSQGEYWRIVTGGFLHGSAMHIAVNMYSLYILGRVVEVTAGSRRMSQIYGISLVGSGLAVVYFGGPLEVTVGASGAIFGLFGALFAIAFKFGRPGMRFVQANLPVLGVNLIMTFAVPGISRWGHVGGLVVGFAVASAIYTPPSRRTERVPAGRAESAGTSV